MHTGQYQKKYVPVGDEEVKWENITLEQTIYWLKPYYRNVDDVLIAMSQGSTIRTPWAYYRWIEANNG